MKAPLLDEQQIQLALKNREFREARIEELRREKQRNEKDGRWDIHIQYGSIVLVMIVSFTLPIPPAKILPFWSICYFLTWMYLPSRRASKSLTIDMELRWLLAVDLTLDGSTERFKAAMNSDAPQ